MNTDQLLAALKAPIDFKAKIAKAAQEAYRESMENIWLENRLNEERELVYKQKLYTRPQGLPDKPGTVRNPGIRREPQNQHLHKKMWANQ